MNRWYAWSTISFQRSPLLVVHRPVHRAGGFPAVVGGDHGHVHPELLHQALELGELHDDADGAGPGRRLGEDAVGRGRDVIAARGRHPPHRDDHGAPVLLVGEGRQLSPDAVGARDGAARRVDPQDDRLDQVVLARLADLLQDVIHVAVGDQAADLDDGDLGDRAELARNVAFVHRRADAEPPWREHQVHEDRQAQDRPEEAPEAAAPRLALDVDRRPGRGGPAFTDVSIGGIPFVCVLDGVGAARPLS